MIHDDVNRLGLDLFNMLASGGALITVNCSDPCEMFTFAATVGIWVYSGFDLLFQNSDDFLGGTELKSYMPSYIDANATHVLVDHNGVVNGGIKLVYHHYGQ